MDGISQASQRRQGTSELGHTGLMTSPTILAGVYGFSFLAPPRPLLAPPDASALLSAVCKSMLTVNMMILSHMHGGAQLASSCTLALGRPDVCVS